MDNKYSVTFKMVTSLTKYTQDGKTDYSTAGHIWYVLQKNNEQPQSFGFTQLDLPSGDKTGKITDEDDLIYEGADKAGVITIQINQQQYENLLRFGD